MVVLRTPEEMKIWRSQIEGTVGFVPTMGALHTGHETLIQASKEQCQHTILSIFVNPLQFNNSSDFLNYPKTMDQDLRIAESRGVDAVFIPEKNQMYRSEDPVILSERELSEKMEGKYRPGHFNGVLTVVLKLFNLAKPTKAYFGKKDYQQYLLIQKLCEDLFLNIDVVGIETVRDEKGLALSSRNLRLNSKEIEIAQNINVVLKAVKSSAEATQQLENLGFKVDYVEDHWGRRFVAAFLGEVRLIDNVRL